MATPGTWVTILLDATFAGGRHDVGTVLETQQGFDTSPPRCKLDDEGKIKRYFVPGRRPALRPKLHKLPVDAADVLTPAGIEALSSETAKGKAEVASKEIA